MTALERTGPNAIVEPARAAGVVTREEFGAQQIATTAEIGTSALAAQARAEVEARYVMAARYRRDEDVARQRLLKSCKRAKFAEKAWYAKPQGKRKNDKGQWVPNFVEGLSVRFAEEAARLWGNLWRGAPVIHEDEHQRIVRVFVTDLESNYTASADVAVEKVVERKDPIGRVVIGIRTNSSGEKTYTVLATDEEVFAKVNNVVSRIRRNLILEHLPADVKEEATEMISQARSGAFAADPDAERKRHADAFAELGVSATDLKAHLGHDLAQITEQEATYLGSLYWAIKDGETTWADVDARHQKAAAEAPANPPASAEPVVKKTATAALRASLAQKVTTPAPTPTASTPAPAPECPTVLQVAICDRVATLFGKGADVAGAVDSILGGVGVQDIAIDLDAATARTAIAAFDAEIARRGKK